MNKEFIKTYKAEFDHWLNGGSLLYRHFNYVEQEYTPWEEIKSNFLWDAVSIGCPMVVINDEYVEFRKALAEGKTIEYNPKSPFHDRWDTVLTIDPSKDSSPKNYRIKPEEPKFKVGDWVRVKTNVFEYDGTARISKGVKQLSKSDMWVFSENHYKCNPDNYIELWQPKPGEWCWFYQSKREIPTLGNLKYFSDKDGFCAYSTPKASMSVKYFKHCEPFLGQLPTNLQETL